MIPTVPAEAFDGTRLDRRGVLVVAFLADWCGFCHRFAPELDRLVRAGCTVVACDLTDEESPLWERFGIEIVPTLIVFRDGEIVVRADGLGGIGIVPGRVDGVRDAALAAAKSGPSGAP